MPTDCHCASCGVPNPSPLTIHEEDGQRLVLCLDCPLPLKPLIPLSEGERVLRDSLRLALEQANLVEKHAGDTYWHIHRALLRVEGPGPANYWVENGEWPDDDVTDEWWLNAVSESVYGSGYNAHLDTPNPHTSQPWARVWDAGYAARREDDAADAADNEAARMAGMAFGAQGYNDTMGY